MILFNNLKYFSYMWDNIVISVSQIVEAESQHHQG
jgi:hypothetical protein